MPFPRILLNSARNALVFLIALVGMGIQFTVFVVVPVLFLAVSWGRTPPREAELLASFQEHRDSFERIRDMMIEDQLATVAGYGESFARSPYMYFKANDLDIPNQRAALYRALLKRVDCPRVDRADNTDVSFRVAGWGFMSEGWRIFLVWTKTPPQDLGPSIDAFKKTREDRQSSSHPIGDDWYLSIVW